MKFLTILLLTLILISCDNNPPHTPETTIISTKEDSSKKDSVAIAKVKIPKKMSQKDSVKLEALKEGVTELENFIPSTEEASTFPACSYTKAVLYELNGFGNHSQAESVFRQRTGRLSKELSKKQLYEFLKLINSEKSFGNSTAACHEPRVGLVFYDEQGRPCSYLSLCLACNNIYTEPNLNHDLETGTDSGFSLKSRKKLHQIFESWDIADYSYSFLFDDFELYERSMLQNGIPEEEIEGMWKQLHPNDK